MTETLLNYLNTEIKLSKKIKNIDSDFKNGYLLAELLSKTGFLTSNNFAHFNKEAKSKADIKQNYILLRQHLQNLGIHIDDFTINELANNAKGIVAKIIYKIKTQIDRRNINFDNIMNKINGYQNEEKKDKLNETTSCAFNKKAYKTISHYDDNKKPELTYISTFYDTKATFSNIKRKPSDKDVDVHLGLNINTLCNNTEEQFLSDKILKAKKNVKKKLEPISQRSNDIMPKIYKKKKSKDIIISLNKKDKIINEMEENTDGIMKMDSKLYQQQQKKFKSHGKNEQKIKAFSERYLENNNKYMKYSCFDRNALKIGLDLKEIDPKLYKQGIGYKNDYIPNEIVLDRLKKKVNQKEEEFKKKIEEKKFMTEDERYLKNSIISQNLKNQNEKKFQINFDKNTQLFKMHEYENYRKEAFPFKKKINKDLLYIKSERDENEYNNKIDKKGFATTNDRFYTKTIMTNFSKEYNKLFNNNEFNEYEFFAELNKEEHEKRKMHTEQKKIEREYNYDKIKNIVYLIVDLTDECYFYQKKKKIELMDLPEYKDLLTHFIKGKIHLSKSNNNNNSLVNLEDENLKKNSDNEKEELDYLNNEKYISEYNDYIFYRGAWKESDFIPKKFYGSQLQVYQILGEEIIHLTSSGKMVTQGVKHSLLMNMKNDEFELKEVEKDNIIIPKENTKNRLFGEIIELNFDNLPHNFEMNNINKNLGLINTNKILNNKKKIYNQEMTYSNDDDTLYTNIKDKDTIKINTSVINTSSKKLPVNSNIIHNDLNISGEKQDVNSVDETSFNNNNLTTNINNNSNLNTNNENNTNINYQNVKKNQNVENDFSHIPIKICLIGHSFSGRKTQAKLLCEKYPKLKYYSLENIINKYFEEYERLHTPIENNPKQKNLKKNQLDQLKAQRLEELKQYEYIFSILEPFIKDNKKEKDLSDEAKINIFIDLIKKDFPVKGGDIYEDIAKRNLRKQTIEQDLERLKEECEKKKKYGAKEMREQQLLEKEYDDLTKEGYYGFILVDFPNNYNQYIKFENIMTGFVQQIDKEENMRDKYLDLLTYSIDKPYTNISNLCPDVINYLGFGNKNLSNSFFNNYIWLEIDEEETLKRVNDRLIDETTNIIYHKDFNPPPQNDKKLMERLKPITEPTEEEIKNELKKYDIEFPKILGYISLFHNLKRISKINKNEILEEIDEVLLNAVKKFEDREIKDEIVALNNFDLDEEENIKYFKKLNEVKKKVNKELSGNIISLWSESVYNYSKSVKKFLYNFALLKNNISEKMDIMQQIFIQYLNNPSQKKKLVEIFQKKYEVFIEKYNYLKKKNIVKEEFQKDVVELTEHFWEIIQMKKRDAINELKNLKDQNFIDKQFESFWKYISDLFIAETIFYIKKINIIRKYYYEFEGSKYSEKCPYEYSFDEQDILKDTNNFIIFNKDYKKTNKDKDIDNKKENNTKDKENYNNSIDFQSEEISPRIDKMFKNCFKFLFYYDKKINEIFQKEKEKYALNISNISTITKRKHRKKNIMDGKSEPSIYSESKTLISYETEMKAALNNEKIKYKIRISLLKYFSEQFLVEAFNISDRTFDNIDKSIIKSVDAQNNAMNTLMSKIKKDIKQGKNKIEYNIELDVFNIYNKLIINFKEFTLNYYNSLDTKVKKVNMNELNKIYLDLKNYEIQDNYVTINSVIDIVFKKHLFEFQSNAFVKYLKELPYHYLNNFIKKFIYKTSAGQNLVRIDRLFTILAIINFSPPKSSQKKEILESVSDKLKFHCFLSKEDFLNTYLWFETEDNVDNSSSIYNLNTYKSNKINTQRINLVEKTPKKSEIIVEEKCEHNNDIDNKDYLDDINNDIIIRDNDDININNEQRQQMNTLFKNLTTKTPFRTKSRKTSKKFTKITSAPVKIINDEIKLKDFLFNINKNYDNQINFIDFMNVTSLQFIKNRNKKTKGNKNINVNLLLKWAKSGELPKQTKNDYRKSTNLDENEYLSTKKGAIQDNQHRSSSIHYINQNDLILNKAKPEKTYLGGDSEYSIMKEDEYIYINDKKYSTDSFKGNIFVETTYLDELIEDNS